MGNMNIKLDEMELAICRSIYIEALCLPHKELCARMQPFLASLRDTIAFNSGKTAEEVQNIYEDFIGNM